MEGVLNKNVFLFLTTYALEATTKATVTAKGSALFFNYDLYEHDVKFPLATLFGGRKHRSKFNFFSESELGCVPQDSLRKFTVYLPF